MIASTPSNSLLAGAEQDDAGDREVLVSKLRTYGLRVTVPRIALLNALAGAGQPLTIDQLFSRTGDQICDLVTIYRTMAAFEKAGVVYRSGFSARGAAMFSVVTSAARKYPLLRKGSAVAEELDDESSRELRVTIDRIRNRLRARGYGELEHIVEFFAVGPTRAGDVGL